MGHPLFFVKKAAKRAEMGKQRKHRGSEKVHNEKVVVTKKKIMIYIVRNCDMMMEEMRKGVSENGVFRQNSPS